jgi:hypothetical protein
MTMMKLVAQGQMWENEFGGIKTGNYSQIQQLCCTVSISSIGCLYTKKLTKECWYDSCVHRHSSESEIGSA